MGDRRKQALGVQFDGKLRLGFHGAKISNHAGPLAFRELDETFRLTESRQRLDSGRKSGDGAPQTAQRRLQTKRRLISPLETTVKSRKKSA